MSCTHLDDDALVERFEALAIAPADFGHPEHVRLAFALLRREPDFGAAALRFRAALRRFADAVGATAKYHETLTWAYLALVAERMAADPAERSLEWIARHPDLLDHRGGALARYYDVAAVTASPVARAVFVLPRR
jgi:hypothetical protein